MQEEAAFPDRIWGALKEHTDAPALADSDTKFQEGRRYQLLEVAVCLVMAKLRPDFQWTVTPVQGDRGIDFIGTQKLFEVEGLELAGYEVIAGQCKRAKGKIRLEKELSYDVIRITEFAKPSHVVLAVAAPASQEQQARARSQFINRYHRPFTFFGLRELDLLFRQHLSALVPLFEQSLDPDRSAELIGHFSPPEAEPDAVPYVQIRSPEVGATGVPFEVDLAFEAAGATNAKISWRWVSPTLMISGSEVATLRLIAPALADEDTGRTLVLYPTARATATLCLVGYVTGLQSLGELLLTDEQGGVKARVGLGDIDLADQNMPPFYWEPFRKQLVQFEDLWKRVKAGVPVGAAVTGAGGAGKTRLCEEFGFRATRDEGSYFQVSHAKTLDWPYRVFRELLTKLASSSDTTNSPAEEILSYLASRNTSLAERFKPTVQLLFAGSKPANDSPQVFDEENLVQLLCFVLLENSREHPLIIHVTECHWGQHSGYNIFAETLARLKSTGSRDLARILFLFEGRIGEALANSSGDMVLQGVAPWEEFKDNHLAEILHVPPLSADQSAELLEYVFESSETPYRRVPRSLLVNQDELKREIIRYAKGNPFHLVEQINFLRQEGTITRNERTGLFYLAERPQRRYEPPQAVEDLIRFRLDYLRQTNAEAVRLICALAFVKDRVSRDLYRHLRLRLAPTLDRNALVASEFLEGVLGTVGEVTFRHENYFRVAHRYNLSAEDLAHVGDVYLDWFRASEGSPPQTLFERALVLQRLENSPAKEVQDLLRVVIDASENNHTHELSIRALELLISSYSHLDLSIDPLPVLEEVQGYRFRLSKLVTFVGDWAEAAATLEHITRDIEHIFETRHELCGTRQRLEESYFSAKIELADAKKNQLRHHEAIEILSGVLSELKLRRKADHLATPNAKDNWTKLYLWAGDRLGVALWFEGHLEEGRSVLEDGLRLARQVSDPLIEYNYLLDHGTLLLHEDPKQGLRELDRALEIVRHPKVPTLPRDEYIVAWQRCLGEILLQQTSGAEDEEAMNRIVQRLQQIYFEAERGAYSHETGGTALLIGSCMARLGDLGARSWLMRAISIARRSNYLEYLWKGHLNLAQFLLTLDLDEIEGPAHHAEQAQHLMVGDLHSRRARRNRNARVRLFLLPLAQLSRIWHSIGDSRGEALRTAYPQLEEFFSESGEIKQERSSPDQILHISNGSADYFLMN